MDELIRQNRIFNEKMRAMEERNIQLDQMMKEKDAQIRKEKEKCRRLERELKLLRQKNHQVISEQMAADRTLIEATGLLFGD